MTKVIGVRFRTAGKIYYFSPGKFEIKQGDHVIVETARGVEYGKVVIGSPQSRIRRQKRKIEKKKRKHFRFVWKRSESMVWR